jgi:hypothetical protein
MKPSLTVAQQHILDQALLCVPARSRDRVAATILATLDAGPISNGELHSAIREVLNTRFPTYGQRVGGMT